MTEPTYPTGVTPPTAGYTVREHEDTTFLPAVLRRTSWGAVIAGAIVAISAQMLFTVLGIAIGATALDTRFDPAAQVRDGFDLAAAAWWLATGTVSLLIGGLVVGRFAGITRSPDLLLHGLTMWGVTALFGFATIASASTSVLYGTNLNAAYSGAQAAGVHRGDQPREVALVSDREPGFEREPIGQEMTPQEKKQAVEYVKGASWWTLGALLLGIAASIGGAWLTAPSRIVLRSPSMG